jgi:hypothetical protein
MTPGIAVAIAYVHDQQPGVVKVFFELFGFQQKREVNHENSYS